jgi:hypothetical protein
VTLSIGQGKLTACMPVKVWYARATDWYEQWWMVGVEIVQIQPQISADDVIRVSLNLRCRSKHIWRNVNSD